MGRLDRHWREDIAPWESWSSHLQTAFWRDARVEVYVLGIKYKARIQTPKIIIRALAKYTFLPSFHPLSFIHSFIHSFFLSDTQHSICL